MGFKKTDPDGRTLSRQFRGAYGKLTKREILLLSSIVTLVLCVVGLIIMAANARRGAFVYLSSCAELLLLAL